MSASQSSKVDKYGVIARYATGPQRTDFEEDFRNDSYRWDFMNVPWENYEVRGYFFAHDNVNDEVSAGLGGGRHSSGSKPRDYSLGIDSDDGSTTRYRFEEKHPNYQTGQSGKGSGQGGGVGIIDRWVGFAFVIRNVSNGVLLEIWQDQGDNSGNEPANQWKLIASWIDTKFNQRTRPSDAMTFLRIDGNVDELEYKWVCAQQILDSDSDDPNDNSSGGTGGSGSGSGGTGDGTGGSGSGTSTPAPPPPPPPEVYQEVNFEMMWNVNHKSGDPCNVNAPPEFDTPVELFSSDGDDAFVNIPKDMRACGWFVNKDSVLIGRKLRAIKIFMKKQGSPLEGDIIINVINSNNDVVDTFDTVLAVNALDENTTEYTFERESPTRVLRQNDRISIDWIDGDGDTVNYIRVQITEQDKVDSTATCLFVTDDNQHIEVTEPLDLAGSVYI